MAGQAVAGRSTVPASSVTLPAAVDWQAEYQGQHLCSDAAKPGAVKLSKLLADTYGKYTTYISRSCATPGISEHEEGRALDWMVDSENATAREKAWQFLEWVTADGPGGEPAVMARRLGIMYLIYEDKMWRVYRPEDGWQEYQGCSTKQDEGYDTSCHRDHIHMSLTWDGAYARTSFWTGKAEDRGPCESATSQRPNGSASEPVTLIDGNSGKGVTGKNCRLGADAYSSRSYKVKVPVPSSGAAVQQIRVKNFTVNSPVGMTVRSAKTVTVPSDTQPGTVIDVPLAADGVITVTLGAGYGDIVLEGVGTGSGAAPAPAPAPAPEPAPAPSAPASSEATTTVMLRALSKPGRVNTAAVAKGLIKDSPKKGKLLILRRPTAGAWELVGGGDVTNGKFKVPIVATSVPGSYEYQAVVMKRGKLLGQSEVQPAQILPAEVSLADVDDVRRKKPVSLTGEVLGAPQGGQLQLFVRAKGEKKWRRGKQRPLSGSGPFTFVRRFAQPGEYRLQVVLLDGKKSIDKSPKQVLTVAK